MVLRVTTKALVPVCRRRLSCWLLSRQLWQINLHAR